MKKSGNAFKVEVHTFTRRHTYIKILKKIFIDNQKIESKFHTYLLLAQALKK